jgi:heavy metal sensor kinase
VAPAEDPPAAARTVGAHREQWRRGAPDGRRVTALVGRWVAPEQGRLATLAGTVVATGVALLALALAGGVWLARRGVAPIARMAATAERISAKDLTTRLDVADVPAELRELATTFNGTLDRLAAAFERQARFTADASHELRTPVAVIRTQAELALRRERTPAEYRAGLEACLRAAERMTATVEGLLTLARADAGAGLPSAEPVLLRPVVEAAAEALREPAAAAGVTLAVDVPADLAVGGDRTLLLEVAQNLLGNAVRYNRPGGTVTSTAAVHAGQVEWRVADTGIGIPPHALPHLFERFYRVDPARSRAAGGSGLGLAIVAWIVEAHGGTVAVTSTEGAGSTFTVRLPLVERPGPTSQLPRPTSAATGA